MQPYEQQAEKDKARAAKDKAEYDNGGGASSSKPASKKAKAA